MLIKCHPLKKSDQLEEHQQRIMDAGAKDPFISIRVFCTKDVNILYSNCTKGFDSYPMEDMIIESFFH